MQHLGQKHGGQTLLEDSVGQLRWLNRQACVHCGTQWFRRCNCCGLSANFVLETPRTQRPLVGQPGSNFLRARSQCLQENLWTTARFRTAPSGTSF